MKASAVLVCFCLHVSHCVVTWRGFTSRLTSNEDNNERPIIGVLSVDIEEGLRKQYQWAESYIPSSYVKFVEMAGARVVPVLINRGDDYYEYLFNSINGLLLPGGGVELKDSSSGYYKASANMFKRAVAANDNQDYFPIWATCLGFEMLSILLSPNQSYWLTTCSAEDIALPLNLTQDFQTSRMFKNVPSDTFIADLKSKALTANFHSMCLTPENVVASGLDKIIHILSTNNDKNGLEFVSTYEALKYPFYGVQWHPEKNPFEWSPKSKNIPRSYEAMFTTQFTANVFVEDARQSNHNFHDPASEDKSLINRYRAYYTEESNTTFTEVYLFHKTDTNW